MRLNILSLIIAAALAAGCTKEAPKEVSSAPLRFSVEQEHDMTVSTKTSAYATSMTYETQMNSVQVTIYDSSTGTQAAHLDLGSSTSGEVYLRTGRSYTMFVMVNGPDMSSYQTPASYSQATVTLSCCSRDAGTGFLMVNPSESFTMTSEGLSRTVTVKRAAARVALVSVSNGMDVPVTLDNVFLTNVLGKGMVSYMRNYVGGAFAPPASAIDESNWCNKEGRADESTRVSTHIIDGASWTASYPALTFSSLGGATLASGATTTFSGSPVLLYGFPNVGMPTGTNTVTPSGFHATYPKPQTCIVLACTVRGIRCYYPVPMPSFAANTAYTVSITIGGLGSFDPAVLVDRTSLEVTLTADPWDEVEYSETI